VAPSSSYERSVLHFVGDVAFAQKAGAQHLALREFLVKQLDGDAHAVSVHGLVDSAHRADAE
jgi:hypothetical protein